MSNRFFRAALLGTTVIAGMGFAAPAFAQDATNTPGAQTASPNPAEQDETQSPAPTPNTAQDSADQEVVVTGTIFRTTTSNTVSPITVVSAEAMDQRGNSTVQDAIQQLASNNGPALTNSFTANGAFAAGASAVSLRGLSTNSTLVLFDGQRAAYYPLADDGARNFVDLNTIPDDIIDRIEVLRDGASSTYGADAIAGVVNIITKRSFQGVSARAEAGVAEEGYGAMRRFSVTAGTGDLDDNGINAYVSGFYYKTDAVYNRDLSYPFNTDNQLGVCFGGVCGHNNIVNGRDENGFLDGFFIGYDTYVRPYDATNTTAQGRYELLNPAAGCRYGPAIQPTADELATSAAMPLEDVCQTDITNLFGVVTPNIERFGGSARVTARLGDDHEGYFMVNFQQSKVDYTGFPPVIRGAANAGILFRPFSTAAGPAANLAPGSFVLSLPVWVCPGGVGDASGLNTGCNAGSPGAILNPNNPFAADNQIARIIGRPIEEPTYNETRSRVYRAAAGLTGTINVAGDWDYRVDLTAMHNDLRRTQKGYVYIANLLTAIAQGTFDFVNPNQNSQAALDFISPDNINDASSDLYAAQVTFARDLFELPGGAVQFGFGGQVRYEAVDAPSGNPDYNGPTQRFFTLNAFGTSGSRVVKSAFFEVKAPVLDMLDLEGSGRYDSYSSGQSAFSPKLGLKFQPIDQLTVRATWSKGFRIPAFGESNALPTTGFVTTNVANFTDSFLAQYGCSIATYANCPAYIRNNSYGQTTLASPDLDPEKSRSITLGAVFQPIRNLTFTVDYYDIKKTGAITQPSNAPALEAYYSCTLAQYNGGTCPIPDGYNVIAGAADPNTPGALPVIGFIEAQLVNANTIRSRGLDFAALAKFNFGDIRWTSSLEASRILELSTKFPGGGEERYEGTLGNFNLTAGSGTPKWHGSWQNTIDWGKLSVTGTANFFGGYNLSAEDQGGEQGDCSLTPFIDPDTGEHTYCDVDDYITFDLVTQFKATEKFTFYINVLNLFDKMPPIDPVTYGAFNYNAVQGGQGVLGRMYRAGVRVNF